MVIISFKCKIPDNYIAFCSASELNKQNLRDRTLDLSFFSRYKHITSLKNHLPLALGESLPYWFWGNFCCRVCFDSLVERISFVCSHYSL